MTMQACQILESHKGELREVAVPEPGPGQVLVKIGGAGACTPTCISRRHPGPVVGAPVHTRPRERGLGREAGPGATGFAPSDPVLVYGPWGCGTCPICRVSMENYCEHNGGPSRSQ